MLKKALCLCHRSDYSASFQHKFKDNNHGFVFSRHARPLRPENAGENQNQREGKTGTSGSTKLPTQILKTGLSFSPAPAIFSPFLLPVFCSRAQGFASKLFFESKVCNTSARLSWWTAVLLTQYLAALLRRSCSSAVVPAGAECGAVNEAPRGNTSPGTLFHTDHWRRNVPTLSPDIQTCFLANGN